MTYMPVDIIVDQKGKRKHLIDTLNLLAYVILLVLVLITTWLLKRKKRLCLHETGLAIIYGMVMGAALRYGGLEVKISSQTLTSEIPLSAPDDYVIVEARNLGDKVANQTHVYAYEFRGELQPNSKLGSQISYASVDPEVFFNIILPPIVLNAGLSLKRRHFFRNIGAIFSYAFIGTSISVAFVGGFIYAAINVIKLFLGYTYLADHFSLANCLYFGAIISPTDPLAVLAIFQELGVDVNLFALVFGESILNDAVSIVLTHSIDHFGLIFGENPYYPLWLAIWQSIVNFINMFLTSCLIGIQFGVITALTTKFSKLTESSLLETCLVVLMSYSSFLTAEVIDASGIVAILLCGITQAHYTINNLSFEARERIKNLFELLTFLCENFLFLAVGVAFWQRDQTWDLSFIGIAFVAVIIARALSIYPLTAILNLGRRNKIPCNFQHVIAWGGAARGVISYSLAAKNTVGDARRIMLSTTAVIVIFSVISVGGFVEPMLKCLKIPFTGEREDDQDLIGEEGEEGGGGRFEEQDDEDDAFGRHNTMISGNNPNWLVRRKRLRRSSSEASIPVTPSCIISSKLSSSRQQQTSTQPAHNERDHLYSQHSSSHNQQPHSAMTTPILEVEAIWPSRRPGEFPRQSQFDLNSHSSSVITTNQEQPLACVPEVEDQDQPSKLSPIAAAAAAAASAATGVLDDREGMIDLKGCGCQISPATGSAAFVQPPAQVERGEDVNCLSELPKLVLHSPSEGHHCTQLLSPASSLEAAARNSHLAVGERAYANASLVRRWRNIDNNFIKPLLTNSHPTLMDTLPQSLGGFARLFTSDEQLMRHQLHPRPPPRPPHTRNHPPSSHPSFQQHHHHHHHHHSTSRN